MRRMGGKDLDPGSAVDAQGNPTGDPSAALDGAFLPWGGHRGYGLSLVVQVLAIMAGGKMVAEEVTDSGFFFLVIDPALLGAADDFRAHVGELVAHIEASRPAPGVEKVRVPGRGSLAKRAKAEALGKIEVDQAVFDTLMALRGK